MPHLRPSRWPGARQPRHSNNRSPRIRELWRDRTRDPAARVCVSAQWTKRDHQACGWEGASWPAEAADRRINSGLVDLNLLRAFFLDWRTRNDLRLVEDVIRLNAEAGGWLIFATHDVASVPSPYGCDPDFFDAVVDRATRSGARVVPMMQACRGASDRLCRLVSRGGETSCIGDEFSLDPAGVHKKLRRTSDGFYPQSIAERVDKSINRDLRKGNPHRWSGDPDRASRGRSI